MSDEQFSGLLEENIIGGTEQESNIRSVSKELFSKKDIEVRTDLSHNEINAAAKILFLKKKFKLQGVDELMNSFFELRVSKDRLSRKEFIDALQTENRSIRPAGWRQALGLAPNNSGGRYP